MNKGRIEEDKASEKTHHTQRNTYDADRRTEEQGKERGRTGDPP